MMITPVAGNAVSPQFDMLTSCSAPINRITKLPGLPDTSPSVSNTRKTPVTRGLDATLHQRQKLPTISPTEVRVRATVTYVR